MLVAYSINCICNWRSFVRNGGTMQNINKSISLFTEAQVRLSIQQSTSSEIKCGYEC